MRKVLFTLSFILVLSICACGDIELTKNQTTPESIPSALTASSLPVPAPSNSPSTSPLSYFMPSVSPSSPYGFVPLEEYGSWYDKDNESSDVYYDGERLIGGNEAINLKTKEVTLLIKKGCSCSQIYKGYIYYCYNKDSIYRIKFDGTGKELIFRQKGKEIGWFQIAEDVIFYYFADKVFLGVKKDDFYWKRNLYRIDIDGKNRERLADGFYWTLYYYKGCMYYSDQTVYESCEFVKYNIETKKSETIIPDGDKDYQPIKIGNKLRFQGEEYDLDSNVLRGAPEITAIPDGTPYYQWFLYIDGSDLIANDTVTGESNTIYKIAEGQVGNIIYSDKDCIIFSTTDYKNIYYYELKLVNGSFAAYEIYETKY